MIFQFLHVPDFTKLRSSLKGLYHHHIITLFLIIMFILNNRIFSQDYHITSRDYSNSYHTSDFDYFLLLFFVLNFLIMILNITMIVELNIESLS